MRRLLDSVGNSVPHIRVAAIQVHLHPHARLLFLILAILHSFKLMKRLLDRSVSVHTRDGVPLAHTSVFLDFLSWQKCQHEF